MDLSLTRYATVKHHGFVIDRITNSHFQLNHPDGRRITIPPDTYAVSGHYYPFELQEILTKIRFREFIPIHARFYGPKNQEIGKVITWLPIH